MALTACQASVLKRQILLDRKYTIIQPFCEATTDCAIQSDEMWTHFTYEDNNFYMMFECVHHTVVEELYPIQISTYSLHRILSDF